MTNTASLSTHKPLNALKQLKWQCVLLLRLFYFILLPYSMILATSMDWDCQEAIQRAAHLLIC